MDSRERARLRGVAGRRNRQGESRGRRGPEGPQDARPVPARRRADGQAREGGRRALRSDVGAGGRLGLPVAIHVGDPEAFFLPIDRFNERYEELAAHPDWSFHGKDFPAFKEILEARDRVFASHPKTTFVALHVGHWAENLPAVGEMLDKFPNVHVEIGARIGELGRQPRTSARFFDRYQDRILFGTDAIPLGIETPQQVFGEDLYQIYYRFLETEDEYFDYAPARGAAAGPMEDLWPGSSGTNPAEGVPPERRTSVGDEARHGVRDHEQTPHLPSVVCENSDRAAAMSPFAHVLDRARRSQAAPPLFAYVGTFSSPLRDMLPTQVDLPPGNGRGIPSSGPTATTGALMARGSSRWGPARAAWHQRRGDAACIRPTRPTTSATTSRHGQRVRSIGRW